MSSTTLNNGRFCNQLIRNLCVSLIAKKHDLQVNYANNVRFKQLGLDLYSGSTVFPITNVLNDANFFNVLSIPRGSFNCNLNSDQAYFQTREITNYLYKYLHSDCIKDKIIKANPYQERYQNNNDCFVHIRLGDVAARNPGLNYYKKALARLVFDKLYIASDSPKHEIVLNIQALYKDKVVLVSTDEVNTIQMGSTCKYVVLSHGSFSACIGYLAFYSQVYYARYDENTRWYGDMFSILDWNMV